LSDCKHLSKKNAQIFTQILREGVSADEKRKETPNDISMDDEWIYRKKPETKSEKAWTKNKGSFPARDVFYAIESLIK